MRNFMLVFVFSFGVVAAEPILPPAPPDDSETTPSEVVKPIVVRPAIKKASKPLNVEESNDDELAVDFLGVYLGCSLDKWKKVMKESKMVLLSQNIDDGMIEYVYSGNNRLKNVEGTFYYFWEGKLCKVALLIKTAEAEKTYEALKIKMEEKYGKMEEDINFTTKNCKSMKDGMFFRLELKKNLFDEPKSMIGLQAAHCQITMADLNKKVNDLDGF